MANEEQLGILGQGVKVWNRWREENPSIKIQLSGVNLVEENLEGINFSRVDLNFANLRESTLTRANLSGSQLMRVELSQASMANANLEGSVLWNADFSMSFLYETNFRKALINGATFLGTNLRKADLSQANLKFSDLSGAELIEADLTNTQLHSVNFTAANLSAANLMFADLTGAIFVNTNVEKAKISGAKVYGVNVWDLIGEFDEQRNLVITRDGEQIVTVDNIEVAQFLYLLLNNQKVRNVIDTVTTKAVLILGRFYEERKQVLDALKDALRERGFVPILFDFEPSRQRDLTETIQLLANMAKFVIADITDAKSIPQELSQIIPHLPSVPVQPILLMAEKAYAMFEHWRSFKTVLPEFLYRDQQDLIDNLEAKILQPIDSWRKGQDEVSILQNRIQELETKLSGSK